MKTKSQSPVGSLHPILFFAVMYLIALFFAIFICSAIFYQINGPSAQVENPVAPPEVSPTEPVLAAGYP